VTAVLLASLLVAAPGAALQTGPAEWLDAHASRILADSQVPGLSVAVVYEGTATLRGLGVASLESREPVDAVRTRFAVGSVTKPVVAAAVLRLAERGLLRLDEPIGSSPATELGWLEAALATSPFEAPTVGNLLTHTGGFDERLAGTAAGWAAEVLAPGDYLREHLPPRIYPPGRVVLYSNHGYTLLGALVERVTGKPWARAVSDEVLVPAGMTDSSFDARPRAAQGYDVRREPAAPVPLAPLQIGPAAGLVTTAADMSRFLRALLDGEPQVLSPAARERMLSTQFSHAPGLPGLAYGLFETFYFSRRNLVHPGGVRGFFALLVLVPESRLGIFVAVNGESAEPCWRIADGLVRHLLGPGRAASPAAGPAPAGVDGVYRHAKHAHGGPEKVAVLRAAGELTVRSTEAGLLVGGVRFAPAAPGVFQELGGFARAGFVPPAEDVPALLSLDADDYVRLRFWETSAFLQISLVAIVLALAAAFLPLREPRPLSLSVSEPDAAPLGARAPRSLRLARVVAALHLGFLAGAALLMASVSRGDIWRGLPGTLAVLRVVPLLAAPPTALLLLRAARDLRERLPPRHAIRAVVVSLAALSVYPILASLGLLGFGR
jgi:CubicO group peptidase (beta-lactamase class C family)